jgi:hypothetical protein
MSAEIADRVDLEFLALIGSFRLAGPILTV